jgi:hypothetical protein
LQHTEDEPLIAMWLKIDVKWVTGFQQEN